MTLLIFAQTGSNRSSTTQVSIIQSKAKFTAIDRLANVCEEVIITSHGKPEYRLLPIVNTTQRVALPDDTALDRKSKPCNGMKKSR